MFFSLDESVLDFLDVGQARRFFDGVEGFVDHFHVPLVVVDQFHFLLVVDYQFSQSLLQHCGRVVLDGIYLSGFDATAAVEPGVLEFFVEFGQASVVVGFIFFVLHLEAEHQVLAHVGSVLAGFDVFS